MHPQFSKNQVLKYHRPGVSRKSVLNNQPSSYIKKNTKLYPTKLRIMLHIEANNKLWNNWELISVKLKDNLVTISWEVI